MFAAVVVPSIILIVASLLIPESPRWLLTQGRAREAGTVLTRIGGTKYARAELAQIEGTVAAEKGAASVGTQWRELLRAPIRRIFLIGIALAVLQQWTGINVLFNYAADIYRGAGYGANDILLNIVITGVINFVFTVLAIMLVDQLGRRKLMLFGCIGIAISHLICALAYFQHWQGIVILGLTLCAIAFYALTLAPITWVLISEIFPTRVRSTAVSASVSSLWIAAFALTYTFPLLNHALGTGALFAFYGIICLLGFALVFFFVPETKGCGLEQIEQLFQKQK